MTDLDPIDYYALREAHERHVAKGCSDPAIASIHLDMATRYADLVSGKTRPGHIFR